MTYPQDLLNTMILCAKEIGTRARELRNDLDESDSRFSIFTQIIRDNERIEGEARTTLALIYDGHI